MSKHVLKLISLVIVIAVLFNCQNQIFAKTDQGKFTIFLGASNNGEIGPCG